MSLKAHQSLIFHQPLTIPVAKNKYKLFREYEYFWIEDNEVHKISVPTTFYSDGASVPRLMWTLTGLRPDGLIRAAALVHDYLYHYKGKLPYNKHSVYNGTPDDFLTDYFNPKYNEGKVVHHVWRASNYVFSRQEADNAFFNIMDEAGMNSFRTKLAWAGVRVAGRFYW